jgi:predicted nuclease of restriction endonuclease-like RecB superfamily
MLTGKLVRVRYARDRIVPRYLNTADPLWLEVAERLREVFRDHQGSTRGELAEEVRDTFGSDPAQLVQQGLAKLLEDRCEFEVVSGQPPEHLREAVFQAATRHRRQSPATPIGPSELMRFDRWAVLREVAASLNLPPEAIDQGLFADLKSEQRLRQFKDITAKHLLQRYNVALAQAVLLRSARVDVNVRQETPQRYRQLLRQIKFHRLICEVNAAGRNAFHFQLDGPLSLFSATQKYGLQLALFLPTVLLCRDFELRAELRWGPQRKTKQFHLSPGDGLVSHLADTGIYVPPELTMFAELFRKKITDWEITEETDLLALGDHFWVPDYRLVHRPTGRSVYLEVLGFWRRASAERHLERLRQHRREPFLLAVSDQLRIDDAGLEGLPAGIHRFRQMPLPDEIVRLAGEVLTSTGS